MGLHLKAPEKTEAQLKAIAASGNSVEARKAKAELKTRTHEELKRLVRAL